MIKKPPKESDLCKVFIKNVRQLKAWNYYKTAFIILHIANEHKATDNPYRDKAFINHLIAMGMLPGAADYFILYKPGKIACIEFKRGVREKLTDNQLIFRQDCIDLDIDYLLTYNVDEALAFMKTLLG